MDIKNDKNLAINTSNCHLGKLKHMTNFFIRKVASVFLISVCFFPFVPGSSANVSENKLKNTLTKCIRKEKSKVTKVDCIFPIGAECRPAFYLNKYHFRFQSSPLDWMKDYTLETAIHFFKTQFKDFFDEVKEIPSKFSSNCRIIKDTKNNVVSIHHFRKNIPLSEEKIRVKNLMLHRAEQVDKILKKSKSIGLICNRPNESDKEFIDFIKKFSNIYKGKKITLINIADNKNATSVKKSTVFEEGNLKIIKFTFNDKTPGGNPENKPGWIGNYLAWDTVMKSIELSDKVFGNTKFPEKFVD